MVRELEGVLRDDCGGQGFGMDEDEVGGDPINSECDGLLAFFFVGLEGRDNLEVWRDSGGVWGEHASEIPRLNVSALGLTLTEDVVGSEPLLSRVTSSGFTSVGDLSFSRSLGLSMGWEGAPTRYSGSVGGLEQGLGNDVGEVGSGLCIPDMGNLVEGSLWGSGTKD